MQRILFISCLFFLVGRVTAQVDSEKMDTGATEIFRVVEQMPEFPGGMDAYKSFIQKNLKYPVMASEQGIQGKVWISFVVEKDGTISDITLLKGIGAGCDEEAMRVIKLMPKWTPGTQGGRPVNVKYNCPINFLLK